MLGFIAIVIGGVLGAAWGDDGFAAAAGAAIGWLLLRTWQQGRDVAALRKMLATLQPPPAVPQPHEAVVVEPDVAASEPAPRGGEVVLDEMPTEPAAPLAVAAATEIAGPATSQASAPPPPSPLEPIKAWLFGGNTIVKAGIGILFIGLAFLAKYASEHVHVPIEFRLASIGGVALVLLALGWRLRNRRAQYAQVLQGGAIAVLYLTLFAAFKFYNVLAVGPAFALMVVVAALAAALAVLQDARSLAVVGALGGFATPLLVSSGSGNYIALFSYYLVLDLGIALVAWHRTWRSLNLIGFAATFLVATAWGVLDYRPDRYASSQAFLI
ncbi:MAG TPA: DUF2339 domain-containing protein, partial [Burkholderiaceae bacterium]|nr:DUF2339 domain-containing protein [Burkholderiaceae bacterium]